MNGETLDHVWTVVGARSTVAPVWLVLVAAVVGGVAVLVPQVWPVTRNLVTIAHEGAHALVALGSGRRLAGIRLHSDTSGVTVSAGRPTGLGMILTAFAGYVGPSLMGLAAAATLSAGYTAAMLWGTLALLALMLLQIRNFYGALSVLLTAAAVFAVSWWTPGTVQAGFGYTLAWFLLMAGPRPVAELQIKRRLGEATESDADQLAQLTGVSGLVWVVLFAGTTLTCLLAGARLLLF